MLLYHIVFGTDNGHPRDELEDLVQWYFNSLLHAGQACGSYFVTWFKEELGVHALMADKNAHALKHHSTWGRKHLKQITKLFGHAPLWTLIDDEDGTSLRSWRKSESLVLYSCCNTMSPPLRDGKSFKPIPTYLLPLTDTQKLDLHRWQTAYWDFDNTWLRSSALEFESYKQLADPLSDLSDQGFDLREAIEEATGIPTYYYLFRYCAWQDDKEKKRRCPKCGKPWRHKPKQENAPFTDFHFRCAHCRIVSHEGCHVEPRHAHIGDDKTGRTEKRGISRDA